MRLERGCRSDKERKLCRKQVASRDEKRRRGAAREEEREDANRTGKGREVQARREASSGICERGPDTHAINAKMVCAAGQRDGGGRVTE